jgi:hypothetical protein
LRRLSGSVKVTFRIYETGRNGKRRKTMAKEPTKPPEGSKKPTPRNWRRDPFIRESKTTPPLPSRPDPFIGATHTSEPSDWVQAEIDGESGRVRALPDPPEAGPPIEYVPNTPLARAMLEGGLTNGPGYEPQSRTDQESPDCVPVTPTIVPTFEPPGERVGEAGGPFWDSIPPGDVPPDFEGTIYEPYAIIKDMRALYTDFINDVMDATYKLRSTALKYLCRAIALTFGSVVLSMLVVGALGVFGAVWLFKALDWAEHKYWLSRPGDPDTADYLPRERPWQ